MTETGFKLPEKTMGSPKIAEEDFSMPQFFYEPGNHRRRSSTSSKDMDS